MDWVTLRSRGKELVRKYRYVLLVVLAGLFPVSYTHLTLPTT